MIQPYNLTLTAPRWAPFDFSIAITGLDLTGATAAMQVRQYFDQPGAELLDLVSTGALATKLDLSTDTSGDDPVGTIRIKISKVDMGSLPAASEPGDDAELAYDLHVTPLGVTEGVYFRGSFIVQAGATQ